MHAFFALLKKELKELVNLQLILPLIITTCIFIGIGKIAQSEQERAARTQPIVVVDKDASAASGQVEEILKAADFEIKEADGTDIAGAMRSADALAAVVIPQGFGAGLAAGERQELQTYASIKSFSLIGNRASSVVDAAIAALNRDFGGQMARQAGLDPAIASQPIANAPHTILGDRQAEISAAQVLGYVFSRTTVIPVVFFFVIIMAAQMIAVAVASEKENKTLETLLTLPIKRGHVVIAKMLAAGIVGLISAAFYMVGFVTYLRGMGADSGGSIPEAVQAQLGLQLGAWDWSIIGLSLFLGMLVALALAMITGAFAEDTKSVQGLLTPLIAFTFIPYILTMFADIATAATWLKAVAYALPFTHSFLAAPNMLIGNAETAYWGIGYLVIIFALLVWITAKIFTTDRIVTLKLTFNKKRTPSA